MPIVSRKEFAELCLDGEKQLNVYISRNKVSTIAGNKKLIDTEDPVNSAFISDRIMANSVKMSGEKPIKDEKPLKVKVEKPPKPAKEPKIVVAKPPKIPKEKPIKQSKGTVKAEKKPVKESEKPKGSPKPSAMPKLIRVMQEAQNLVNADRVRQDYQKKQLEIENLELSRQQKELLLQKSAGQLLPVDLTRGIIERNANSIFKSFEQGLGRIAAIYCNIMAGGDRKMMGQIVSHGKEILGECIAEAGQLTAEEIKVLVTDFSQQLMRGQRKA